MTNFSTIFASCLYRSTIGVRLSLWRKANGRSKAISAVYLQVIINYRKRFSKISLFGSGGQMPVTGDKWSAKHWLITILSKPSAIDHSDSISAGFVSWFCQETRSQFLRVLTGSLRLLWKSNLITFGFCFLDKPLRNVLLAVTKPTLRSHIKDTSTATFQKKRPESSSTK